MKRHSKYGPTVPIVGFFPLVLVLCWSAPAPAQDFLRGDVNGDALVNMADAIVSLIYQFQGADTPGCLSALDTNDDGDVDVSDPVYSFMHLFGMGDPPAFPFPDCGEDPSPDDIGCERADACSLGGPFDGLTVDEIMAFNRGKELMKKRFTPSEGLGPFYNTTSCANCHEDPVVGGSSPAYRNFYIVGIGEVGDQVPIQDPEIPSLVLPSYGILDGPRANIPDMGPAGEPVAVTQRNAPPMFGTGLFELISNITINSNADPNDTITPDGISGRFNTDGNNNLGRFGYKAQANFIEAFIRGASNNQMGITTDPVEGSDGIVMLRQIGGPADDPITDNDGIPDPEISVEDFADIIAFSRFLRAPKKLPFGPDEELGEAKFDELGCTKCHIPSLPSSRGPVEAFTDLLIHDMGPELADGISQGLPQLSTISGQTTESEFRTQPLWGVRLHAPFLHDGRADTLNDAISMHGGEAAAIRDAYLALPQDERDAIISFLEAL